MERHLRREIVSIIRDCGWLAILKQKFEKVKRIHYVLYSKDRQEIFETQFCCLICTDPKTKTFNSILNLMIHYMFLHRDHQYSIVMPTKDFLDLSINKNLSQYKETSICFFPSYSQMIRIKGKIQIYFQSIFGFVFNTELPNPKLINDIQDKIVRKEMILKIKEQCQTFYHSHNLIKPISDDSLFIESEDEDDNDLIEKLEKDHINDFIDTCDSEKEYFILWNGFMRKAKKNKLKEEIIAFTTKKLSETLLEFLLENINSLRKLRTPFLLHLILLQRLGHIKASDILFTMNKFEDLAA